MNINEFTNHQFMYKLPSNKLYKLKSTPREINSIPAILEISYQIPFQNEFLRNNNSLINSYKESKEKLNLNIFQNTFLQNNPMKIKDIKNPFRKLLEDKMKIKPFKLKGKKVKLKLSFSNEEQKNNLIISRNKIPIDNFNKSDNKKYNDNLITDLKTKLLKSEKKKSLTGLKIKTNINFPEIEGNNNFIIHSVRNKN